MSQVELDLVLAGGHVIDPSQNIDASMEVGIRGRRIVAVGNNLPRSKKTRVMDCTGLMVVPGLIDLHVHAAPGVAELSVDPDRLLIEGGTTTLLDAGTIGVSTWPALRDEMQRTRAHLLGLVHLCSSGLSGNRQGELRSPHLADPEGAVRLIREFPTRVVGVKIRAGTHLIGEGEQGWSLLRQAVWAARESGTFLMVHIGSTPMSLAELVAELEPGDMITHCYKGGEYGHKVIDDHGRVFPELLEAAERGIVFDVGHGQGSFSWDVAERAVDQGLYPTTVSTDLHRGCIEGPVYDLPLTMTKMMHLGFSLSDVVKQATWTPAKLLGLEGEIGTLRSGATADVTLLRWEEGDWSLTDSYGHVRKADRALRAAGVVRDGDVVVMPR